MTGDKEADIRTCIAPMVHDLGSTLAATYKGMKLEESEGEVRSKGEWGYVM